MESPVKPPTSPSHLNNFETEEKAHNAEALLKNDVFNNAMDDVYSRAVGTLLQAEIGSLTASAAHAMMLAVTDIRHQLEQYINDHKMRQKYNKGDK